MEASLKQQAYQLLDQLPEDATFEDLMHELYELRAIERGLADIKAGRLTPHEEAKKQVMGKIHKTA